MITRPTTRTAPHPENCNGVANKVLSPKMVAGALTATLLVLGTTLFISLGGGVFGNQVNQERSSAQKVADAQWWEMAAQKSKGDLNQLLAQDRQKAVLLARSEDNARDMLTQSYRNFLRANSPVSNAQSRQANPPAFIMEMRRRMENK